MGTGFSKQKKQAKMMQEQLMKFQSQMQTTEVTGTAGNGLVTLCLSGEHDLKSLVIKPDCVDPEDVEGLQDLIKAAYKDALEKLKKQSQMPNIPGMPDLGSLGF